MNEIATKYIKPINVQLHIVAPTNKQNLVCQERTNKLPWKVGMPCRIMFAKDA